MMKRTSSEFLRRQRAKQVFDRQGAVGEMHHPAAKLVPFKRQAGEFGVVRVVFNQQDFARHF